MPFSFNAADLCVVNIDEKPWKRPREVYKALEYGKVTKAADIVKHLCSRENYAHKWQLTKFVSETNLMDWLKGSRKGDYYIDEVGIYEIVFSSQKPKGKEFRRHCCNVLFPHVQQQLTNKMKEGHQQAIEEKIQQLHYLMMIYRNVNMKTWHCRLKRMCIRLSYKNVKISSPILKHVMFLMRKILIKTTSSSLYGNIQRLPMIGFMTCHIMLQGYNDVKGMLN